MFKAILHKIFPPPEVRDTINHIKEFLKQNASFSREVVQFKAIRLARQTEKTVNFISKQYHHPEHLALLLITNVISNEIVHKKYKKGQKIMARDMLRLWDIATEQMRDKQYYSSLEYRKDCEWIDKKCTWLRTNITPREQRRQSES